MRDPIQISIAFVDRLAMTDNAVKLLFDHVRNILIGGALFATVAWQWQQHAAKPTTFSLIASICVSFVFVSLGTFLLVVNWHHGQRHLSQSTTPKWAVRLFSTLYGVIMVTLIMSVSRIFG